MWKKHLTVEKVGIIRQKSEKQPPHEKVKHHATIGIIPVWIHR
ncbi:MAG: hypothetical protein ABWU13_21290 [Limnospira maxima]